MTTNPIKGVKTNMDDTKSILKSIPKIRETIKDCQFDVESLVLLDALLSNAERDANLCSFVSSRD